MTVVVDAAAAGDNSIGVCVAGWLAGWAGAFPDDELHVVVPAEFADRAGFGSLPPVALHGFGPGTRERLRAQHVTVPSLLRQLPGSVLLTTVPQLPVRVGDAGVVAVCHDLRHELLPAEFSRGRRMLRWVEYRRAYARADRLVAVSDRTRLDLARLHPRTAGKTATVHHGADHLAARPPGSHPEEPVALAFAHHVNKRPALVMRAWQAALGSGLRVPPLVVVGAPAPLAAQLDELRTSLGLDAETVRVEPYLTDGAYASLLDRVAVVVLASTFEGFGLPVLEGLRLGAAVVITPEPAMVEVGGPVVTVAADDSPTSLAAAVAHAAATADDATREAGRDWAARFTWAAAAAGLRRELLAARDGTAPGD